MVLMSLCRAVADHPECDDPMVLPVEIESASLDYSRDQNKKGNKIPVVSVSDRSKRMGNYGTSSHIYTVEYEIKGDRGKMLGKTIEVGNVP